jgi:ABC-type dipeptide/oligopeptide/nickel transport system permease subunit
MTTQQDHLEKNDASPTVPDPQVGAGDYDFAGASRSQSQEAFHRFVRTPTAIVSFVVFVGIVLFSYIYPHFYRWDFGTIDARKDAKGNLANLSDPPGTNGHPLGTDGTGYDLMARLMRGTQRDFVIVIITTALTLTIGIALGAIAGYYGNVVDNLVMRFVDIMLSVPALVILIVVSNHYKSVSNSAAGLAVLLGLFGWMGLSRLVRAQFLALKEREFVEAAHAMGAPTRRIILRHLLPNSLGTILVFGTLVAATAIIAETSLTFLGFGVQPPDTSLGLLVSQGVDAADTRSWLFYYPGLLILVIVLAVNLIGDGIRNAYDPKNNRVRD